MACEKSLADENLNRIAYQANVSRIDNSLANDNWDRVFQDFEDSNREFIEKSCQIAEALIDKLEQDDKLPIKA